MAAWPYTEWMKYFCEKGKIMNERLEQVKKDIKLLEEEKRRLEEPRLKHGDYGHYNGNVGDNCVVVSVAGELRVSNRYGLCNFKLSDRNHRNFVKKGNIYEDLS